MGEFLNMEVPLWAVVAYYIFMAVVSGMPTPSEKDSKGYIWLFGTLHALSANLSRAQVGFSKRNGGTVIGQVSPAVKAAEKENSK